VPVELEWGQITVLGIAALSAISYTVSMHIAKRRKRDIHASRPYAETPPTFDSDVTGLV
jgi:hypothetical protein